jgi:hypothetical protein
MEWRPGLGCRGATAAGGVRRSEGRYSLEDEETRTVNGELAGKHTGEEKRRGEGQTVMDSTKNLGVEAEFAGDKKRGRKSSPNLRRRFAGMQAVEAELRRGVEGATSGGSR